MQSVLRLDPDTNSFVCCPKRFVLCLSGGVLPDFYPFNPGDHEADSFSGGALRYMLDNSDTPSSPPRLPEGRYVFGLSVDPFNPLLSKQAGRTVSVTPIYMILLNPPPLSVTTWGTCT